MSPKVIAFSGACHSGKTTVINRLKELLTQNGHDVVVLNELMRSVTDTSITKLRRHPAEYLRVQEKIINGKIKSEIDARYERIFGSNPIFLIDRAIGDSLYYLTFYTDKAELTDSQFSLFTSISNRAIVHADFAYRCVYDYVVMLEPIMTNFEYDKYRPENQFLVSKLEYTMIQAYNVFFLNRCKKLNKLVYADAQTNAVKTVLNLLNIRL